MPWVHCYCFSKTSTVEEASSDIKEVSSDAVRIDHLRILRAISSGFSHSACMAFWDIFQKNRPFVFER